MDKDHLPLLEDQNPVRRSEKFAGTRSMKVVLTEDIKSLSNVSGREVGVTVEKFYTNDGIVHRRDNLLIVRLNF